MNSSYRSVVGVALVWSCRVLVGEASRASHGLAQGSPARLHSMGCGASKDTRVDPIDIPPKAAPTQAGPAPTPNQSLPPHPGMLKQPSSAAAASASTPATAAGAAHPASLRQAHPASLSSAGGAASGAAQEQGGDGSSVGKSKSRRDSRRGSSFSQSVVNRLGEGSIVGSVISKAAELVDDSPRLHAGPRPAGSGTVRCAWPYRRQPVLQLIQPA